MLRFINRRMESSHPVSQAFGANGIEHRLLGVVRSEERGTLPAHTMINRWENGQREE